MFSWTGAGVSGTSLFRKNAGKVAIVFLLDTALPWSSVRPLAASAEKLLLHFHRAQPRAARRRIACALFIAGRQRMLGEQVRPAKLRERPKLFFDLAIVQ